MVFILSWVMKYIYAKCIIYSLFLVEGFFEGFGNIWNDLEDFGKFWRCGKFG